MKHVIRLLAVCSLLLAFAFGAAAEMVSFTDALGQTFTLEPPQRVVTLMGSFAHVWLLAGGEESLVGTSEDTTDTRDLGIPEDVVSVGTYQNPNMEAIISLDPDLVLLSSDTVRTSNHVALKDSLAAAQIPAAYFKVTHFEDYLAMLKTCTLLTGEEAAYAQNGEAVALEVERVIAEGKREDAPSVLLMITYSGGVRPQGEDTMTGRMLAQLGCRNILSDFPSLLSDFSMERIMEIDPDYIFVIPMGNDEEAIRRNLQKSVESNPAWSGLTAVMEGRYILLPGDKFLYKPNAAWADSYEYLAQLLSSAHK